MKNILCPIDFSTCSVDALRVAASFTRKANGKLQIMHIINMPMSQEGSSKGSFQAIPEGMFLIKLVKKKFAKLLGQDFLDGLNIDTIIAYNTVYETIAEKAVEYDTDLIVMGSHGTSGMSDFIGSNTERVIRSSDVPILVVKKNVEIDFNNIVFASNFKEESYHVFSKVLGFARIFDAHVHLLKVNTPNYFETTKDTEDLVDQFVDATNIDLAHSINIYNDNTIEDGIHHFADKIDADIIIMETHGRKGIKHLLWGSITENVANHSDLPVLSIKMTD